MTKELQRLWKIFDKLSINIPSDGMGPKGPVCSEHAIKGSRFSFLDKVLSVCSFNMDNLSDIAKRFPFFMRAVNYRLACESASIFLISPSIAIIITLVQLSLKLFLLAQWQWFDAGVFDGSSRKKHKGRGGRGIKKLTGQFLPGGEPFSC